MSSDLVAMPQRERSALALYQRERNEFEIQYIRYLRSIADEQCALQISSEMSDAEIAELDELVLAKVNVLIKHYRLLLAGSLVVVFSAAAVMITLPLAVFGLLPGFCGLTLSLLLRDTYSFKFFTARKRLQKICGENYLPYDAVRQRALRR